MGKHSADNAAPGSWTPTVKASAPGKKGTKGPTSTRRRAPQHSGAGTAKKEPTGAARKARDDKRKAEVIDAARDFANREAWKRTEGRPSITGRAAAGAAAGTATGAAVGGPVGAAAGAAIGGVGGALSGRKAKKAYDMAMRSNVGARRIIVAEFLLCMVVLALSPLTDRKKEEGPTAFMKRATAIMGLFFILGLVSSAGRGAAKGAAGFGGVVTVALLLSNRDVFIRIGQIFGSADEPEGPKEDIPDPVGQGDEESVP